MRGGSASRDDDGALETVDPPEEPDDPDELDPEPEGRGIAWAEATTGTASAIASATTMIERGFLSMTMHSFNGSYPTGRLQLQTLQQYCHQTAPLEVVGSRLADQIGCPQ
jgi:hypothetical protein